MTKTLSHVLCIDDEDDILEIVKLCLQDIGGLKATCHNDIERALDTVLDVKPDLILLDVMMPKINGLDAIRLFREKMPLACPPVILMTARIQPKEIEGYLAAGACGVIAKPFDPMTLVDQIRALWDKTNG